MPTSRAQVSPAPCWKHQVAKHVDLGLDWQNLWRGRSEIHLPGAGQSCSPIQIGNHIWHQTPRLPNQTHLLVATGDLLKFPCENTSQDRFLHVLAGNFRFYRGWLVATGLSRSGARDVPPTITSESESGHTQFPNK